MPLFPPGWGSDDAPRRRRPKAAKPIDNAARLRVEDLEKRQLFALNVWLPQRIAPVDGVSGFGQDKQLFLPATTSMRPDLGLQSGSMTLAGSFTFNDLSSFSLSLRESGPDGSGCFVFSESLSVEYLLSEWGHFNAAGFSLDSVIFSPSGAGSWSFLQTDGSGHTVTYLSGFGMAGAVGTTPPDPIFVAGFNWLDVTWSLSSNNGLGLPSLNATSLTVQETIGLDSFAFVESNGTATLSGSGSQALMDSLEESGQQSYSDAVTESFNYSNSGSDIFSLSEEGSYSGGSFALSSVAYNEQSSAASSTGGMGGGGGLGLGGGGTPASQGGDSFQFTDTLVRTRSGSGAESGSQSFAGTNPSLADSSSDSFQFGELDTYSYGESGTDSYVLFLGGSFSGGSFGLDSLNFNAAGGGSYSLTETSNHTQSDGFSDSDNETGHGSFGIGGTLTDGDTVTQTGTDSSTAGETVQDSGTANYTVTMQGGYGGGSFGLSNFSLTESAGGNVTFQQADTQSDHGSETDTSVDAGIDSYILGLGAGDTQSGTDNSGSSDSESGGFSEAVTDSITRTAASSYSLSEIGSSQNGSYSLSSYAFRTGIAGNFTETSTGNETTSDTGSAGESGSSGDSVSDVQGGNSDGETGGDSFQSSESFISQSTETSTAAESGAFGQSTYQAGSYSNGSWAFDSVAYTRAANDTALLTATDTNTEVGSDTQSDSGDGQSNETTASGPTSDNGLEGETFSDSDNDSFSDFGGGTITESSHDSSGFSEIGSYANGRYIFSNVVYSATGGSNDTTLDNGGGNSSGTGSDVTSDSGSGTDTSTSGVGSDDGLDSFSDGDNSGFSEQSNDTFAETVTAVETWTLSEIGNFSNGSWGLSSVVYSEGVSDTTTLFQNDNGSESGTETSSDADANNNGETTTYGGGSFNGTGSVNESESESETFTESSGDTVTGTDLASFSLSEAGVFSGGSFSFASLVYRGGDSASETIQKSSLETLHGTALDTSGELGQGDGVGSYTNASDGDLESFSDSRSEQDSVAGNESEGETDIEGRQDSFYEAGGYANGSYAFTSVAFSDAVTDNTTFQGLDTTTTTGTFAENDNEGDSTSFDLQPGGGLDCVSTGETSGDTVSGVECQTSHDSFNGSDSSSFSLTQLGAYSNGSFAFASWVSRSGDSFSETAADTFSGGFSESGLESDGGSTGESLSAAAGSESVAQSDSESDAGSDSFVESGGDSGSQTDLISRTSSNYEAGGYANGSFNLSSVAFSQASNDSWSEQDSATSTKNEAETLTVNGTFRSSDTALYGGESLTGGDSLGEGATFSGSDTLTALDTTSDSGSHSWSLSEQGTYSGDSFAFSSVAYQDGESDNGTFLESDVDTFASTSGESSSDGSQDGDGDSLGQDGSSDQDGDTAVESFLAGEVGHGNGSMTDVGGGSFSLRELGSYAGGSFAFGSVNYHSGSSDSETATDSSTASDTWGLSGTDSGSDGGADTGAYGSTTDGGQESATDSLGENVTASGTQTDSDTQTEQGSFSLTELGSYAGGSYAFSSYLLTEGQAETVSAQETDTEGLGGTESGVLTDGSANTAAAVVSGSGLLTVSDGGNDSVRDVVNMVLSGTDTTTETGGGFLRESLSQGGVFSGGSLSLTSVVFSETSGESATVQDNATFSDGDTEQVNETQSNTDAGADAGDSSSGSGNESYGELDTVTATDAATDNSSMTETVYEAGAYANGSYSLSSFNLLEQSAETDSVSDVSQDASAETGTGAGTDGVDGYTAYNGSDNFTEAGSSTEGVTGTATSGFVLSELGAYSNGSFSLGNYLLSVQQSSSASVSEVGGSTDSVSGTNQGSSYSGPGSESFSDSDVQSSSGSLTEQGSYANGSFSLGTVTYQGSGDDSFSDSDGDSDSWSGGYSGTDSVSDQEGGTSSFTTYETGNFSNGSFSLSSYLLWGGSSGSYSDGGGDQETLSGSASSFARLVTGQASDTLYQSGSMTAGAFSNASFNYSESKSDTTTDAASGPGYASNDSWADGDGMQESGSGTIATETQTDGTTFSYCEGSDPTDSNGGVVTMTVAPLGPPMGLPLPDVTTVPQGGAGPNLEAVDVTQAALGNAEEGASQAVSDSIDYFPPTIVMAPSAEPGVGGGKTLKVKDHPEKDFDVAVFRDYVKHLDPGVYDYLTSDNGVVVWRKGGWGLKYARSDAESNFVGPVGSMETQVGLLNTLSELEAAQALIKEVKEGFIRANFKGYEVGKVWDKAASGGGADVESLQKFNEWFLKEAAKATDTGAGYIIGWYTIWVKGADIGIAINDVADGNINLGTLLTALRFVPLAKSGVVKIIGKDKKVLAELSSTEARAIREAGEHVPAKKATARLSDPAFAKGYEAIFGNRELLKDLLESAKDGNYGRSLLRDALKSSGTGKVAHHVIPLEATKGASEVMKKAALGGFNINGANNGLALIPDVEHLGGHPGYNKIVIDEINKIPLDLTFAETAAKVQAIVDTLKKAARGSKPFLPNF